jgi:hypothetical protein
VTELHKAPGLAAPHVVGRSNGDPISHQPLGSFASGEATSR